MKCYNLLVPMPKRKLKTNKSFFRPVHLQTILFTAAYLVLSKFVFIKSLATGNIFISFLGPFTFGVVTTFIFLYLFSHEDFFHFIKGLEDKEKKTEKKYLKKYYHHSRILAIILIGIVAGDFFLALTIRFLINKFAYKYIVMIIAVFLSTLISVGIAKGLFSFLI